MTELLARTSPTALTVKLLGVTPHAAQSQFLECRSQTKVACCGRRFGKTVAAAIDALWFAVTRPGTTQMIVAPTADQSKILFDQVRRMAEEGLLVDVIGRVVESPFPELSLVTLNASGAEVESLIMARSVSHDGKYLRGHGADRVVADECAFIPEQVMAQVIPPMLAASPHNELVLISTPFGTGTYFHRAYERGRTGDPTITSFHFPSASNPFLPAAYMEQQRREMTQLAFDTEYGALFLDSQSSVFRQEVITAAIDDTILPGAVDGHRYVIGYDPAKYSDRSGVVVLDVTTTPHRAVEVLDLGGRDYLDQATRIRRLAQTYHSAQVLLDATSHDQMLEELIATGVHAEGYRFSNQSKQDLIDSLALALERGDLRIPNHLDLIKELTYYRFQTTQSGKVRLGAPEGPGHFDDLVTALALATWQAKLGDGLPYAWIRNDPEFRARSLDQQRIVTEEERLNREEERTKARIAAYRAAMEYDQDS